MRSFGFHDSVLKAKNNLDYKNRKQINLDYNNRTHEKWLESLNLFVQYNKMTVFGLSFLPENEKRHFVVVIEIYQKDRNLKSLDQNDYKLDRKKKFHNVHNVLALKINDGEVDINLLAFPYNM